MFKTVLTLFRGTVAVAEEELQDRTALVILDQQMRDAAAAVERSKRALALAIARLIDMVSPSLFRFAGAVFLARH